MKWSNGTHVRDPEVAKYLAYRFHSEQMSHLNLGKHSLITDTPPTVDVRWKKAITAQMTIPEEDRTAISEENFRQLENAGQRRSRAGGSKKGAQVTRRKAQKADDDEEGMYIQCRGPDNADLLLQRLMHRRSRNQR